MASRFPIYAVMTFVVVPVSGTVIPPGDSRRPTAVAA